MKVLFITNSYPTKELPYYGIYIKEQYEFIKKSPNIDCEILILKGKNSILKYFQPLKVMEKIRKFNPDIIHIQYGLTAIPIFLIYPFIFKRKIISTFHGSDINGNFFVSKLSGLLAKISCANIAVSKEIELKLSKYKEKTHHIPCGVDSIFFDRENYTRTNKIIFSGHPDRIVKNYTLFKKITKILESEYNQVFEVIIFDNKSRFEVKDALNSSKCLVMTSISEGSPQVVKEAIVSDLPIVSTPVGDVPFLIKNLSDSFICNDEKEFAEKIVYILNLENKLLNDPDYKESLSNNKVCKKIISIYEVFYEKGN